MKKYYIRRSADTEPETLRASQTLKTLFSDEESVKNGFPLVAARFQ